MTGLRYARKPSNRAGLPLSLNSRCSVGRRCISRSVRFDLSEPIRRFEGSALVRCYLNVLSVLSAFARSSASAGVGLLASLETVSAEQLCAEHLHEVAATRSAATLAGGFQRRRNKPGLRAS
jgi:hypothetical protein